MRAVLKALITTGGGSLITMVLGALTTKIIAIFAGTLGMGIYAQLRQVGQWFTVFATMNGQGSLVRGIAAYEGAVRFRYMIGVGITYLMGMFLATFVLILYAPVLSTFLFTAKNQEIILAIQTLSLVVMLGTISSFIIGIINGFRAILPLTAIQILGALTVTILSYPLILWGKVVAYIVLLGCGSMVISVTGCYLIIRQGWLKEYNFPITWKFEKSLLKEHIYFSYALLLTGLVGTGSVLAMRTLYIHKGGLELGGIFDSAWTLSMMYVMLLLSSFGTYYFPTLSSKRDVIEIQKYVTQILRISTIIATILISFVIVIKPLLVIILYSEKFSLSIKILRWMLIGDYLKITGWVFGMLLLAFNEKLKFTVSEILWNIILVSFVSLWLDKSWEIVGISFITANMVYLIFVGRHAITKYGIKINLHLTRAWGAGILMILFLSALTWNNSSITITPLFIWAVMVLIFLLFATTRDEQKQTYRIVISLLR